MPQIAYIDRDFKSDTLAIIDTARLICEQYAAQGYTITLRQLYYQFVSRNIIPNREQSYKRLGSIINDARLAGLLDWRYIEDRTRNVRLQYHDEFPPDVGEVVRGYGLGYTLDKWSEQPNRIEVWVEKDALTGILEVVCNRNDVPYFACRGYTSQSEAWGASQRMIRYQEGDQDSVILYLGDHDPSGIDMGRDIQSRMDLFAGNVIVDRLALNMDQVQQYNLPPNPAKLTDSRSIDYMARYGLSSWELDALDPATLDAIIQAGIDRYRDVAAWNRTVQRERQERNRIMEIANRWADVEAFLADDDQDLNDPDVDDLLRDR